jgi:hypothetical protein
MIFWGVKFPDIQDSEEVDMDVDAAQSSDGMPYDQVMLSTDKPRYKDAFEEPKESNDYAKKAAVQSRQEEIRASLQSSHAVPPAKGDSFDKSGYSHIEALDKTTFKSNNDSVPADLDYDEFMGKPSSSDTDYINKIEEKHFAFQDTLKQRNQKLKNILSLYSPYKNLNMTLNALETMNDIGVTNDVCSALFADGDFVNNLTMKQCLSALPQCESLFNGKHENHVVTGALSIQKILKHSGQDIITIRNYPVCKGVDLQREERVKICDELLDMFLKVFKGTTIKKRVKYKGNIGKVSKNLYTDLHNFLALADSKGGNDRQAELQ